VRFGDGSAGEYGINIVYALGRRQVLKLYPPYWRHLHTAECSVLTHVAGKLKVATPELLAQGHLEGWPYLVMSRLNDTPLHDIWDTLDEASQHMLLLELAELLAQLHVLPTDQLSGLESNWPTLIEQRVAGCVERHREQGVADEWLEQIP